MDSNSPQNEQLYRAAVGESKAGYYVPLFYRFDQPGASRISWNWPAFFVTFFWMVYRRMYGPAFAYLILYPLVFVILFSILAALLGWATAGFFYWTSALAVQFVLVPMFANALYHWHVRKRIDKLAAQAPSHEALVQRIIGQSSGGAALVVAIVCVGAVFMIGLLAAISIPAYQDYTIRSQITEGLNLATGYKLSVAEAYAASRSWPSDLDGTGTQDSARYVESIDVSDGVILISYGKAANPKISGQLLSLHPRELDGVVEWDCGYTVGDTVTQTNIAPKYLPSQCRNTIEVREIERVQ